MRVTAMFVPIAIALGISATQVACAADLLGTLKSQDAIDGCSWSASAPSIGEGFIFLAEYDQSQVLMSIAGSDVTLKRDPALARGKLAKVGSQLSEVYISPGIRVEALFEVTSACRASDAECEDTRFRVTFKVRRGADSQTVRGTGDVGC
jgi:hypothetical protein